ncbi:hypothetical protein FOZ63_027326 [Perkinsus olseni]|uniref:Uncharacterized protein n=1 Tax=Perkinsus olseni TaxID=32597 RepID=A0A7J6TH95_PEROL|nr:hypothetical protein FOZ63_027326 [Perkinsus olseni]
MKEEIAEPAEAEEEVQQEAEELSLFSLYKKGQLTDCILAMPRVEGQEEEGDEEEEEEGEVKLHKLILASYSRYCYKKIIPPEDEEEEEEEGGDAIVVPQEGGVFRIEIPTLLDPHATRSDTIKCIGVITSFMYMHGDWETAILQNPELMAPSSSSLVQQQQAQCGLLLSRDWGLGSVVEVVVPFSFAGAESDP